jgi:hypothetical protein
VTVFFRGVVVRLYEWDDEYLAYHGIHLRPTGYRGEYELVFSFAPGVAEAIRATPRAVSQVATTVRNDQKPAS